MAAWRSRLVAGGDAGGQFLPVYRANERLSFGTPREEQFFVTNASNGVARLLVCDQDDPVTQPAGRLLRVITVPIDRGELWLKVRFNLDRHLSLRVEAVGQRNVRTDLFTPPRWPNEPVWIQSLNLGFRLPPSV
jgi:hypothetical protein